MLRYLFNARPMSGITGMTSGSMWYPAQPTERGRRSLMPRMTLAAYQEAHGKHTLDTLLSYHVTSLI